MAAQAQPAIYPAVWNGRRERVLRAFFYVVAALAATGILAQTAVVLWARHEFTQVESVVALHANMLANDGTLYYDLNRYPFTVSPYGPIFYCLSALLRKVGAPLLVGGRLISLAALAGILLASWQILRAVVPERNAQVAGILMLACSATLLSWGTVAQVDTLACCLSLFAFLEYVRWRSSRQTWRLCVALLLALSAVFTKQTSIAALGAIVISLLIEYRRRGILWLVAAGAAGLCAAVLLNTAADGNYFTNGIRANLNPFSASKFGQQIRYFLGSCGGVMVIIVCGLRRMPAQLAPLHLYAAITSAVFIATASKVGSDLNYQLEATILLILCAASALERLRLFPLVLSGNRSPVTLLQTAVVVQIAVNLAITTAVVSSRVVLEPVRREEVAALRPFFETGKRVLSVQLDPMAHLRGRVEVEPLIYTLLVEAGVTDPEPVLRDLSERRFHTVVLYEDVFSAPVRKDREVPTLPAAHLQALRSNYRLVRHIAGPYLNGDYVYEPLSD